MPPAQDVISDTSAAITARLAARHDALDILRAVTAAADGVRRRRPQPVLAGALDVTAETARALLAALPVSPSATWPGP
ncbi:hypothetical protein [Kibdelosporangium aridum]|uniref:hypothetical protein n=1 Tax=Kibdelosporangium aridum TaxID=2030 RepID=UPI00117B8918|nr:hypothetical protein [Kibdelosporangium aridum]